MDGLAARTGAGLADLEDALLLQADAMALRASPSGPATGVVVEARDPEDRLPGVPRQVTDPAPDRLRVHPGRRGDEVVVGLGGLPVSLAPPGVVEGDLRCVIEPITRSVASRDVEVARRLIIGRRTVGICGLESLFV
jgi:hypothetical protein